MNIVLIGYRGTGKSSVSRALQGILHCALYSIDEEITRQAGKSIHEIVEQEGWCRFRAIESGVVERISTKARESIIESRVFDEICSTTSLSIARNLGQPSCSTISWIDLPAFRIISSSML